MIQYKLKFVSSAVSPVCGTGNLTIDVNDGDVVHNNNLVALIIVYYSETDNAEWELNLNDGAVDDHVTNCLLTVARDGSGNWPSSGGCRWQRSSGNLLLKFTPPELASVGASALWEFDKETPDLHVKVKIKRQDSANTGACSTWVD